MAEKTVQEQGMAIRPADQRRQLLAETKKILSGKRALLKAPLWLASLASGASSFVDNPVLGSSLFNRLGLHAKRVALAARLTAKRRHTLRHLISAEDKDFFDQNGFVLKENFLAPEHFEQLAQELLGSEFDARETLQGDTVTRRIALDGRVLSGLPHTQAL